MNLAIITARGGSKRIPKKNIRDFCGKPIIAYSIETAKSANCFDKVMVSTDSPEIADTAVRYGAECPVLRSVETSNDFATTADVLVEVLAGYKSRKELPEFACCIYPTAPFITREILEEGFRLISSSPGITSVFPVTRFSYPIQRALKMRDNTVTMFQPEHRLSRSQDLEPAYHDAGQFYWLRVATFLEKPLLFGENSKAIVLPEVLVQDIDTEEDWEMAELKFRMLNPKKSTKTI